MRRVFTSDCEGPISKNDNAFELTAHFVPNGDKLFTKISLYDDVQVDVVKRPDYSAGDTLKLILPFLKAYGVTDKNIQEFSAQNLILVANSRETLHHVASIADAYIISTSYEHYIRALCQFIDFPFKNCYCTQLNIDKYSTNEREKNRIKEFAKEIVQMPMIKIPVNAKSINEFSPTDRETINRLDEIFWNELKGMECGRMISEVRTVGGSQKAEAIEETSKKLNAPIDSMMYVGDSITDVEAFRLVRDNGGLTVSFNGNNYAVNNAEIAVLSENSIVTAVIADMFCKHGKPRTLQVALDWDRESLKNTWVNPILLEHLFEIYPDELPEVQIVTDENREELAKESSVFRKKVRGESVGRLG